MIVMTWPSAVIAAPLMFLASIAAHDVLLGTIRRVGGRWDGLEELFSTPIQFFTRDGYQMYIFSTGCIWLAFVLGGFENRSRAERTRAVLKRSSIVASGRNPRP